MGLVQERPNSSVLAVELCLSCTKPSIWKVQFVQNLLLVWAKQVIVKGNIRIINIFIELNLLLFIILCTFPNLTIWN